MSDEPQDPVDPAPKKSPRGGRIQRKRGNRAVDQLLAGSNVERPPHLLPGRAPGARQPTQAETFDREQPKIPEKLTLPDGREVEVALTKNQRIMLEMTLAGCTTTEIAKAVGLTIPAVRNILAGRTSSHVREAFRLLLEASGLSAPALVAKSHELLGATRAQWNPHEKCWDHFPDYATQLGAWRVLIQLLGFMPARAQAAAGAGPAVTIHTNFGGKEEAPRAEGSFVIEVSGGRRTDGDEDGRVIDVAVEP